MVEKEWYNPDNWRFWDNHKITVQQMWDGDECAFDRFFKEQQNKPPALRQTAAFLVCNCKRCQLKKGIM